MKKRFLTPLNLACGKNKIVDQFHYIYFKDGYIYISNGIVHIKQRMELHGFSGPAIKMMDGFCMHKDVFSLINKHGELNFVPGFFSTEDTEGKVSTLDVTFRIAKSYFTCTIPRFESVPGQGLLVGYIDNLFETFSMEEKKEMALDPDTIELIRKVFVTKCSGFTFRFNKGNGGTLVTPNQTGYQERAIIKPLSLTGEFKK